MVANKTCAGVSPGNRPLLGAGGPVLWPPPPPPPRQVDGAVPRDKHRRECSRQPEPRRLRQQPPTNDLHLQRLNREILPPCWELLADFLVGSSKVNKLFWFFLVLFYLLGSSHSLGGCVDPAPKSCSDPSSPCFPILENASRNCLGENLNRERDGTDFEQFESWNQFKLARRSLRGRREPAPPTNPLTLAACGDSADLFYSQLFPVRASGSDQTGVEGEAGGWAAHGADLKRVLREGIIVWTGL